MKTLHPALLLPIACLSLVLPLGAQTTIEYVSGTTDNTNYSTTPPAGPLTLSIVSGAATQAGNISGTGGIIKAGAGSLTLSGSNSFEGGTILNEGTLRQGDIDALGTGGVTINGGALGNAENDMLAVIENNLTVTADFAMDVLGEGGALEVFGDVDMGAAPVRTLTLTGEGLSCFGGQISGQSIDIVTTATASQAMFCDDKSNVFTGTLRIGSGVKMQLWKVGDGVVAVSGDLKVDAGASVELFNVEQFATTSNVEVNGSLIGISAGTNSINALTGTGTIWGNAGGETLAIRSGTFSGSIIDEQKIVKQGPGSLRLSGSSSYTGGTVVESGTLQAGHNHALGNGDVAVSGGSTLWVEQNVALDVGAGHSITLENDGVTTYRKDFAANEDLTAFGAITSSGSNATVAQLLSGTASAESTVLASFDDEPTVPATNDELRISDVLSLDGLEGDTFVMQLSYTQEAYDAAVLAGLYTSETQLLIGRLEGSSWVAVGSGPFVEGAWNSSYTTLGTYGVDTANNVVWVVTNHNSEFAVVPEPGTAGLLAAGLLAVLLRRNRRAGCFEGAREE